MSINALFVHYNLDVASKRPAPPLDSRALGYFVAVAEELHFGRAAERLDVAQSALSRHLQQLERRLGTRLLNRGRRAAVTLTEAGKALLGEAPVALGQLERAEAAVRRTSRGEAGSIDLGYVISAALCGVLPQALRRFRAGRAAVEVRLAMLDTPAQLAALGGGLQDVGFVRPRAAYPDGVAATVIHREALLLAVAADHPLATRRVDVAALAHENFIIPQFDENAGFAEQLAALAARGGFEPRLTHRVRDFITAVTLAAAGYGVVPIPRSMVAISLPNLVWRPIHQYDGFVELAIAYRRDGLSPAAEAFVDAALRPPARPAPQRGAAAARRT